ncbi:aspartate/glutamate racemase family protein [Antarcticimicrobium sediminis]|uniref:Asp/Glu racemase n=1 Tax=Antarcticimicrobium sediminis TaxID=2546227 RepID=A0A4R5ENM8_9RHOB|nr:aspartate/glutamate racemase family protein [Antarcticimicrobium sediminis]TDE36197.1 Asp/Glu racemase [Antarcticimicrobium sediminis]
MPQILLMNPNANSATTRAMVAIASKILPGVSGWTAPEGPQMIVTEATLDAAAELVGAAVLPACDGVIVSAFGDPGRARLAARLSCPVLGIGAAAARQASALASASGDSSGGSSGGGFAVVTTTPDLAPRIDRMMAGQGGAAYLGCYLTQGEPEALMLDAAALDAALLEASERAARAGAAAVIIGGGPLGEAAERLAECAPVPLISPIRAAATEMAALLAR